MPGSADRLKVVTPSVGGTVGGGCGRRRALFEVVAEDPAVAATSAGLSGRLGDHRRAARRSRPVWRLLRGLRDRAWRPAAAGAVAQYRQLGRGRRTGGCGRHRLPARGVGSVHLAGLAAGSGRLADAGPPAFRAGAGTAAVLADRRAGAVADGMVLGTVDLLEPARVGDHAGPDGGSRATAS